MRLNRCWMRPGIKFEYKAFNTLRNCLKRCLLFADAMVTGYRTYIYHSWHSFVRLRRLFHIMSPVTKMSTQIIYNPQNIGRPRSKIEVSIIYLDGLRMLGAWTLTGTVLSKCYNELAFDELNLNADLITVLTNWLVYYLINRETSTNIDISYQHKEYLYILSIWYRLATVGRI